MELQRLVYYELRNYDKAIYYYDKSIEIDKTYFYPWNNKGLALYYQRKYKDAIKCFDKALDINSSSAESWDHKGEALYRKW